MCDTHLWLLAVVDELFEVFEHGSQKSIAKILLTSKTSQHERQERLVTQQSDAKTNMNIVVTSHGASVVGLPLLDALFHLESAVRRPEAVSAADAVARNAQNFRLNA